MRGCCCNFLLLLLYLAERIERRGTPLNDDDYISMQIKLEISTKQTLFLFARLSQRDKPNQKNYKNNLQSLDNNIKKEIEKNTKIKDILLS